MVKKLFADAKQALIIAYSAGVLASKAQEYAQADLLKYAASISNEQLEKYLCRARKRLELTSTQIDKLLNAKYRDAKVATGTSSFFYHWLEPNLDLADQAEDLIKQLEWTIKSSFILAEAREADPTRLGARPKASPEPGNDSGMYPNVATLKEAAATSPDRTQDWVHETRCGFQ